MRYFYDNTFLNRIARLGNGEHLQIVREDNNNVAHIYTEDNVRIGCLPRYVQVLLKQGNCKTDIIVERKNECMFASYRVLCRMVSCWPDGFVPYSGNEFLPIVEP